MLAITLRRSSLYPSRRNFVLMMIFAFLKKMCPRLWRTTRRSYCISRCRTGRFSVGWCRPLGARKETLWRYSDALNYHEGECLWSQWWPILFIKHFDAFQEGCSRALATATLYRNMLNIMGLVAPWIIILLLRILLKRIFFVQLKIFFSSLFCCFALDFFL